MDGKYKNLPWALAKELSQAQSRPSWESNNEGIHERISFDDTIWGFNLAGGAYYDTPLRVTQVKENSRADKAGIKVGDVLRFINDVDTSLLTLQEAHDIILHSGIEIKLKLSAPDVEEPYHYTYEDEILEELRQIKRKRDEESKQKRKPFTGAKTNSEWSCAWPCNKKRDVTYRESNCFLIPSKHEEKMRLKREKKKLEEDRASERIDKQNKNSMMKTQNAYNMMDSDEEIEPQYFDLLHKNKQDDISKKQVLKYGKIKAELSETSYICEKESETKGMEDEELNNQSIVDVTNNLKENEELTKEKGKNDNKNNEDFICDNNIAATEHDIEIESDDRKDKYSPYENEKYVLGENSLPLINGDLLKIESENEYQNNKKEIDLHNKITFDGEDETQSLRGKCSDNDFFQVEQVILDEIKYVESKNEINLQNIIKLTGEDETLLTDGQCSTPSDDDDLFQEELVILDGSKTVESESENKNQDGYQEIDLQNTIPLTGENETQLSDEEYSIPSDDDYLFHEELMILDEDETDNLTHNKS